MAGKTTDMVKEAMAKRARRTADAPPWLPMLLPAGLAVLALVLLRGLYFGPDLDTSEAPVGALAPPIAATAQVPDIEPDPGLPDAYYVALTAALTFASTGDPGIPTTSGLPLSPLPPVMPETLSFVGEEVVSEEVTLYRFSAKDSQGIEHSFAFSAYYDGVRWLIGE